jgi:uncharacterized protein (TIGR02996 family)
VTDRDALFRAICEHPDDDTARLVFADWLDEHGEAPRAAVLRAGVAVRRASDSGPLVSMAHALRTSIRKGSERIDWSAVAPEVATVFGAHRALFEEKVPPVSVPAALKRVKGIEFLASASGWPDGVSVTDIGAFVRHSAAIFRAGPITKLALAHLTPEVATALLDSGALERVRELELVPGGTARGTDASGLTALGRHPAAGAIRALDIPFPMRPVEVVEALTAGPHWHGLRHLALGGWTFSAPHAPATGVADMLRRPHMRGLRSLVLRQIQPGASAAVALAEGACPELRELKMQSCELAGGATALAHSNKLSALHTLELSNCWVSANEVAQLIIAPNFPNLTALTANFGADPRPAAPAFRGPNRAPTLRVLDLSHARLNADRTAALARCPALAGLWALHLRHCDLKTPALKALTAGAWGELTALDLSGNELSAKSTAVLADWSGAPRLQWLDLSDNALRKDVPRGQSKRWKAIAALAETDRFANLKFLAVSRTDTDDTHTKLLARRYGEIVYRNPR